MLSTTELDAYLSDHLSQQVQSIRQASAVADAFAVHPEQLTDAVLARHLVEHVFRIRLFRPLDAAATRLIEASLPEVAADWSRYARSEAVHDRYFMRDLEGIGATREQVETMTPLPATLALVGFIEAAMEEYGPLPVVLYSFWTEKNSDEGSEAIIARVRSIFGERAVRGASAHRALDETLDHAGVVTALLARLIDSEAKLLAAAGLLEGISQLIADYFVELQAYAKPN